MNLHLGSGTHPSEIPGWLDLDLCVNDEIKPHVAGSMFALPFPDDTFDRIYLGHVLEHLRWEDQLPDGLAEVRRVGKPGGQVMVVGPDIQKGIDTHQPDWLLTAIVSDAPASSPGGHQWVATEGLTVRALERGGFTDANPVNVADVKRPEWPNPSQAPWQCAVTATI